MHHYVRQLSVGLPKIRWNVPMATITGQICKAPLNIGRPMYNITLTLMTCTKEFMAKLYSSPLPNWYRSTWNLYKTVTGTSSTETAVSSGQGYWRLALYGRERFRRSGFRCLCRRPMLTPCRLRTEMFCSTRLASIPAGRQI